MNEPKIRFKGFEGEWKEKKLGEMCTVDRGTRVTRKDLDKGGCFPVYQNTNYPLGYYNKYNVEANNPFIIIGGSAGLMGFSTIPFWAADDCVYFSCSNVDKYFLYNTLLVHQSEIKKEVRGSSVPRLDRKVLADLNVYFPSLPEQQSLATYFTHLDTLITSSASRLASLKQMKAASLQAMFPQEGETVPKIRFKGFEGEWEKVKLGESFDFLKNNSLSRAELSDKGNVINVHYGDVLIKYPDCLDVEKEQVTFVKDASLANKLHRSCPLQKGDVIFADAAEDNTVGKCTELVNCDIPIISGLHTIPVRPLKSYASRYLGYYLNSPSYHNQLLVHIQGSKISSISKRALAQTLVVAPKALLEQRAIAQYFTSLDKQIALQTQRLGKLKQIKAACLDKMFV